MGVALFCFGLLVSNLNALAMASLANAAGIGAATIGAITTVISVPIAVLVGSILDGSAASVAMGFLLCGSIGLTIHLAIQFKGNAPN